MTIIDVGVNAEVACTPAQSGNADDEVASVAGSLLKAFATVPSVPRVAVTVADS